MSKTFLTFILFICSAGFTLLGLNLFMNASTFQLPSNESTQTEQSKPAPDVNGY